MRSLFLAALGCTALAAPAFAADLSTIDCVSEKLKPALTQQIERDVTRNLGESGKKPSYDPSVGSGIRIAAQECAQLHKWSAAAVEAARVYAIAKLGLPIAQRVVAEKGFDAAALEDAFQQLPQETRDRPLEPGALKDLVISVVTEEAQKTRANAELLNEFFLFLSTVQYAAHDFMEA